MTIMAIIMHNIMFRRNLPGGITSWFNHGVWSTSSEYSTGVEVC